MVKKLLVAFALFVGLAGIFTLAGCASGNKAQGGIYRETEITPIVTNDSVSIPVSVIESKRNIHFSLVSAKGNSSFEAYVYNGEIQVRASYCVPCRGTSFTLNGDKLVCDNCGTVFSAKDGTGVSGAPACKGYPKAAVQFETTGGNIVMRMVDLQTAFENTLKPGKEST